MTVLNGLGEYAALCRATHIVQWRSGLFILDCYVVEINAKRRCNEQIILLAGASDGETRYRSVTVLQNLDLVFPLTRKISSKKFEAPH